MPTRRDFRIVWIFGAIVAPAILALIELFHPAGFTVDPGMYQYLSHPEVHDHAHHALDYFGPDWWFWLHMIQTPAVVLVAIALAMSATVLSDGGAIPAQIAAWAARISLYIFAVYYTVLDAIGGPIAHGAGKRAPRRGVARRDVVQLASGFQGLGQSGVRADHPREQGHPSGGLPVAGLGPTTAVTDDALWELGAAMAAGLDP